MKTPSIRLQAKSQYAAADTGSFIARFSRATDVCRADIYRKGAVSQSALEQMISLTLPFQSEFWIAESVDGQVLGRIGANVSATLPGVGYLGFFEAASFDAAQVLVMAAVEWLKSLGGIREIYGPVNFNTWLQYRLRTNQDADSLRFAFEPSNPPEYVTWFENLGFKVAATYHSQAMEGLDGLIEGTRKDFEKATSLGYRFEPMTGERSALKDAEALYRISMSAFAGNLLYEPIAPSFFVELYVPGARKEDQSLAHLALDANGKPVGFFFAFNEAGYLVFKTIAMVPECRGMGISNGLMHVTALAGKNQGLSRSIAALIRDGLQSESYARKQAGLWRHSYALYSMKVPQ